MVELNTKLRELAAQPYTEHPFLSIYLDWNPDGNGKRPQVQTLEQELRGFALRWGGHSEGRTSFEADRERIMEYVQREAPADASGLVIFACQAAGVWETMAFQAPIQTHIAEDRYPHLLQLAQLVDDHEPYAVVLADGQEAHILVVNLESVEQVAETSAGEPIKRFQQGGMAQMLFQRRTDNLIKAHTKDIAAELQKVIDQHQLDHVVIACNDSVKGIVIANMTDKIKERLIDTINMDPTRPLPEVLTRVEPLIQAAERQQEADMVTTFDDQMSTKGGMAAAGASAVALALSKGQVETLLMTQNFAGEGGECESCGMLIAGDWTMCPYDHSKLLPVDLREMFVTKAIQGSSALQFVMESASLDLHDGVGAILRYRDDVPERGEEYPGP